MQAIKKMGSFAVWLIEVIPMLAFIFIISVIFCGGAGACVFGLFPWAANASETVQIIFMIVGGVIGSIGGFWRFFLLEDM
jgi:hypothetical protein